MRKIVFSVIWVVILAFFYLFAFWADQRISQNIAIVTTILTAVFGFVFGLMIAQYKVKQEAFLEALTHMSKAVYEPTPGEHHALNKAFFRILLFANREIVMKATDMVSDMKHNERFKNEAEKMEVLTTKLQKLISMMRDELNASLFSFSRHIKAEEFRQIYTVIIKKSTTEKSPTKSHDKEPTYNFTNCSDISIHKPPQ